MLAALPIDAALDDIRQALRRTRTAVIVAEPGAGKTTRVPPGLLDAGPVLVLQPRRAAARSIARRIADERGWTLGDEVGWQVRFERHFTARTRLLIATEGILTARLQHDPLLTDFATLVIDEFHERSIHADLAIALGRQALEARDDLRLVVMSATIDAERVAAYLGGSPIIRVSGRLHPVRTEYHPDFTPVAAAQHALADTSGNILCFQPGAYEIGRTVADLTASLPRTVDVVPLHGGLSPDEQDHALAPVRGTRRVIVSTNIAETSLTVPHVTAVIDSGVEKVARYDAERGVDSLRTERISQAAADQRAGRAGRVAPGVAYRLWAPADRLHPYRDPDIHRVDLSGVALDIAGWGGDIRTLDWFERPQQDRIEAALELLERLGAMRDGRLTDTGRQMLRLPLHPRLARIVLAGRWTRLAVRAAAILSERLPRAASAATTTSDVLSAIDRWADLPESVKHTASQLDGLRPKQTLEPVALQEGDEAWVRRALLAGYPDRVAKRRTPSAPALLLSSGTGATLGPESGVRSDDYIVALDVHTSTTPGQADHRIRLASAVDPSWLEPTSESLEHRLDDSGTVKARRVVRYGAIVLAEQMEKPDAQTAAELLAGAWRDRPRTDAERRLLNRLHFADIAIDVDALARQAAFGCLRLADVDIEATLPYDVRLSLDRLAPDVIPVPSGRTARVEYADDGTVSAAVKLQELFGLAETPRLGAKREPVLLHLLSPAGRPVQMTRDLASFWARTYPEVRKELRGRYPRHPWPDDPWKATPTHRTKTRSS